MQAPATTPLLPRIELLDHRNPATARRIHAVLMRAHAQEAALLQVRHFAPLDRSVQDVQRDGDRKSTRLNSSHGKLSRMPSSA